MGNRLSTNKEPSYTYDANNQLLAVGQTAYSYDKNGNTISKKGPEETSNFEYNFENRLSKVSKNGIEATYYYDPFGRRLSKTVNGKTTWFAYSDEGLIAEYDEKGKITSSYSWQPGSTWSTDPILTSKAGKHYFYHNDHLGAPTSLTDSLGKLVWQASYDVYGDVKISTEEVSNNLRFPGQYFDKESGLYYNWHRYYEPKTGRYITTDPIGLAGGINSFAYVMGDPVNWFDSTGLSPIDYIKKYLLGLQLGQARGMSTGALAELPNNLSMIGGEGIIMFFPDSCEFGFFTSVSSDLNMSEVNSFIRNIIKNANAYLGAGVGFEFAAYIGDKTPGHANAESFQGPSHTAQFDLVIHGGDLWIGDPNRSGGRWIGGKYDWGPGAGVAVTDWDLVLAGRIVVPECQCKAMIFAM